MVTLNGGYARPGFQSSEKGGTLVNVYRKGTDAFIAARGLDQNGVMPLDGRGPASENPSLISANMSRNMGTPWSFTLSMKAPQLNPNLLEMCTDDDWVDIFLTRWGYSWHTIRGMVDEMRRDRNVTGSGATSTVYTMTGRCFQKAYEDTQIWANRYSKEPVVGAGAIRLIQAPNQTGNVAMTTSYFLKSWLMQIAGYGRANVSMPQSMPNVAETFADTVQILTDGYSNIPARFACSPSLCMPEGSVWELAKAWSDPMFCELYTDLIPSGFSNIGKVVSDIVDISDPTLFSQAAVLGQLATDTSDTTMSVVMRDKPFPMIDPEIAAAGLPVGLDSPYFRIPMYIVPRQYIIADSIGWSGYQRINTALVSSQLLQEFTKGPLVQLVQPLWAPSDMHDHGMRRLDVTSQYLADGEGSLFTMSKVQRLMARDWYCMNPYLMNGTISFGVGLPDLHIGTRLRIPGATSADDDETFYVEGISHAWSVQQGLRTTATVTRGWRGSDADYINTLQAIAAQYSSPPASPPGG